MDEVIHTFNEKIHICISYFNYQILPKKYKTKINGNITYRPIVSIIQ